MSCRRVAAVLLAVLVLAGCTRRTNLGPARTSTESVEPGDAKSAGIDIKLGAGRLVLAGGADKLLDASFTQNVGLKRTEVEYAVRAERGTLTLRQPSQGISGTFFTARGYRNDWNLRLGNTLPLDLSIDIGAGLLDLRLAGIRLNSLNVDFGAASGKIDLSGEWTQSVKVTISGGVGSANLRLPRDVGVRVEVEGGLGAVDAFGFQRSHNTYTNDAWGKTAVGIDVRLEAGIGSVTLELAEPPRV